MTTQSDSTTLAVASTSSTALVLNNDAMDRAFRMADLMAAGRATVPKHLQGSPADCMAVTLQALQWNMSPFAVAQKTHLVNGTLGYEAQLVHAVLQSTGAIAGEFEYQYKGDGDALECRVGAIPRGKTEITWGEWLGVRSVTTKNSPLWKTNPKQQMGYLQVKNWARLYKPGAILGVYTADELESSMVKNMGPVEEVRPEPVPYPAEQFEKNLPQWTQVINSRRKTVEELIAFAQSRNPNTPFTDEQLQRLRAVQPVKNADVTDVAAKGEAAAPAAATATEASDAPVLTFAQVAEKLHAAKDLDALNVAGDLISEVLDTQQQAELNAAYEARIEELSGQ